MSAHPHRFSAHGRSQHLRRLLTRVASVTVLVPWAAFILYGAWPMVAQSVVQLEAFPDTFNPGYFILKIALLLLAVLVLLQALLDLVRPAEGAAP